MDVVWTLKQLCVRTCTIKMKWILVWLNIEREEKVIKPISPSYLRLIFNDKLVRIQQCDVLFGETYRFQSSQRSEIVCAGGDLTSTFRHSDSDRIRTENCTRTINSKDVQYHRLNIGGRCWLCIVENFVYKLYSSLPCFRCMSCVSRSVLVSHRLSNWGEPWLCIV